MYYFYHFLVLFYPGYMLANLLVVNQHKYLLSFSMSYAFVVLTLFVVKHLNVEGFYVIVTWLGYSLLLTIIWIHRNKSVLSSLVRGYGAETRMNLASFGKNQLALMPPVGLIAGVVIYLLIVGPYTEVPADVWWHLGGIQLNYNLDILVSTIQTDQYWHYLEAVFRYLSGLDSRQFILHATIANSITFVLGIYYFSIFLFSDLNRANGIKVAYALTASILFILFFGVNIFSYFRYYVLSYSFLNYIAYLTALLLITRILDINNRTNARDSTILLFLFPAMALIHFQEALFTTIMGVVILFVVLYDKVKDTEIINFIGISLPRLSTKKTSTDHVQTKNTRLLFIAYAVTIISILVWVYSYYYRVRHAPVSPFVINADRIFPFLKNLYISNPTYQFYETITLWGVFVYILYFLWRRQDRWVHPVVRAGMFIPLATLFNPFFVDFFLRYSTADVLWRMGYMITLPFFGAYIFVENIRSINWRNILRGSNLVPITILVLMVYLLTPIQTKFIDAPYARTYTLQPVRKKNNYTVWGDLIEYMSSIEGQRKILTDPVTGYILAATTSHDVPYRYKFYSIKHKDINLKRYERNTFRQYNDWLLVLNKRKGGFSRNGKISKHWSGRVMFLEGKYSDKLDYYVTKNTDIFIKQWEKDNITVYLIKYPELG